MKLRGWQVDLVGSVLDVDPRTCADASDTGG